MYELKYNKEKKSHLNNNINIRRIKNQQMFSI